MFQTRKSVKDNKTWSDCIPIIVVYQRQKCVFSLSMWLSRADMSWRDMFSMELIKDQCYRQHRCSILWRKKKAPLLAHKCSLILIPHIRVHSVHVSPVHFQSCMLPVKTHMQERDFLLEQESLSDFLKEIKAGGRVAGLKTMVKWDVAFW